LLEDGWELTAEEISRRLDINLKTARNVVCSLDDVVKVPTGTRKPRYRLSD
jgi:hypothetical protein